MASQLPFNQLIVGATTVDTDKFVAGSGSLKLAGTDGAHTAANGEVLNFRQSLKPDGSCKLIGDYTSLATQAPSLGVTVELLYDEASIKSFTAVVSCQYDANAKETSVTLSGDPE